MSGVRHYTGIGSRDTPFRILSLMAFLADKFERRGLVLRTGDASGADQAFRSGARNMVVFTRADADRKSTQVARRLHPAWHRCTPAAREYLARNVKQVLGPGLNDPSEFVLCWTPGARLVGGTGLSLMVARERGVPVVNLGERDDWTPAQVIEEILTAKAIKWYTRGSR